VASYFPHRNEGYGTCVTVDVTGIILIGRMLYQNKFICSLKAKITIARLECVCEARKAEGGISVIPRSTAIMSLQVCFPSSSLSASELLAQNVTYVPNKPQ
jgi:hypothetical protein